MSGVGTTSDADGNIIKCLSSVSLEGDAEEGATKFIDTLNAQRRAVGLFDLDLTIDSLKSLQVWQRYALVLRIAEDFSLQPKALRIGAVGGVSESKGGEDEIDVSSLSEEYATTYGYAASGAFVEEFSSLIKENADKARIALSRTPTPIPTVEGTSKKDFIILQDKDLAAINAPIWLARHLKKAPEFIEIINPTVTSDDPIMTEDDSDPNLSLEEFIRYAEFVWAAKQSKFFFSKSVATDEETSLKKQHADTLIIAVSTLLREGKELETGECLLDFFLNSLESNLFSDESSHLTSKQKTMLLYFISAEFQGGRPVDDNNGGRVILPTPIEARTQAIWLKLGSDDKREKFVNMLSDIAGFLSRDSDFGDLEIKSWLAELFNIMQTEFDLLRFDALLNSDEDSSSVDQVTKRLTTLLTIYSNHADLLKSRSEDMLSTLDAILSTIFSHGVDISQQKLVCKEVANTVEQLFLNLKGDTAAQIELNAILFTKPNLAKALEISAGESAKLTSGHALAEMSPEEFVNAMLVEMTPPEDFGNVVLNDKNTFAGNMHVLPEDSALKLVRHYLRSAPLPTLVNLLLKINANLEEKPLNDAENSVNQSERFEKIRVCKVIADILMKPVGWQADNLKYAKSDIEAIYSVTSSLSEIKEQLRLIERCQYYGGTLEGEDRKHFPRCTLEGAKISIPVLLKIQHDLSRSGQIRRTFSHWIDTCGLSKKEGGKFHNSSQEISRNILRMVDFIIDQPGTYTQRERRYLAYQWLKYAFEHLDMPTQLQLSIDLKVARTSRFGAGRHLQGCLEHHSDIRPFWRRDQRTNTEKALDTLLHEVDTKFETQLAGNRLSGAEIYADQSPEKFIKLLEYLDKEGNEVHKRIAHRFITKIGTASYSDLFGKCSTSDLQILFRLTDSRPSLQSGVIAKLVRPRLVKICLDIKQSVPKASILSDESGMGAYAGGAAAAGLSSPSPRRATAAKSSTDPTSLDGLAQSNKALVTPVREVVPSGIAPHTSDNPGETRARTIAMVREDEKAAGLVAQDLASIFSSEVPSTPTRRVLTDKATRLVSEDAGTGVAALDGER